MSHEELLERLKTEHPASDLQWLSGGVDRVLRDDERETALPLMREQIAFWTEAWPHILTNVQSVATLTAERDQLRVDLSFEESVGDAHRKLAQLDIVVFDKIRAERDALRTALEEIYPIVHDAAGRGDIGFRAANLIFEVLGWKAEHEKQIAAAREALGGKS